MRKQGLARGRKTSAPISGCRLRRLRCRARAGGPRTAAPRSGVTQRAGFDFVARARVRSVWRGGSRAPSGLAIRAVCRGIATLPALLGEGAVERGAGKAECRHLHHVVEAETEAAFVCSRYIGAVIFGIRVGSSACLVEFSGEVEFPLQLQAELARVEPGIGRRTEMLAKDARSAPRAGV